MNKTTPIKLISSNVIVASIIFFVWMVTFGLDMTIVYGATKPISYTFDRGVFNITDLSIKDGDYSTSIIGLIENTDPLLNTIKGVSLKIEMYDRNNHLIDVAESGHSLLPATFGPHTKSAFKVPIDKNAELDHVKIQILATDWGTSNTYSNYQSAVQSNTSEYRSITTNTGLLVVKDNDMEPHLKPNDSVKISNSTSFDNLKTGDIIVFIAPEAKAEDGKPKVIVHRVAEIGTFLGKEVIRAKGDANQYSVPGIDYPIFKENYIGKVILVTNNTNNTTRIGDNHK